MRETSIKYSRDIESLIYSSEKIADIEGILKQRLNTGQNIYLIIDENLEKFLPQILSLTKARAYFSIHASEKNKSFETVENIINFLLSQSVSRKDAILAVGGGICCDIAAFVASIYKRGLDCILMPTTVLAQCDAALGGKNGINYQSLKNIIGCIRQPKFIYICSEILSTLDKKEFISGSAEIIKSLIINNLDNKYQEAIKLFSRFYQDYEACFNSKEDLKALSEMIAYAAKVKAEIVSKDPFEKDLRKKLNLGHSFGHAIEWKSANDNSTKEVIRHGEAVAMGMIISARYSLIHNYIDEDFYNKIYSDLESIGFNCVCPYPLEDLQAAMLQDKKAQGEYIDFVLIGGLSKVFIQKTKISEIIESLENYDLHQS